MDGIQAPTTPTNINAPSQNEEAEKTEPGRPEDGERAASPQAETRISVVMAGLLIATALLFDGAQALAEILFSLTVILLPLGIAAGWVIDIFAWLTFFVWLHSLGLGMMKKGGPGQGALNQAPFIIIALAFG